MKNTPYFGVTDFASHAQVVQALACIPSKLERRLHVGVMASYKTVTRIKTKTGWENIWPRGEALRSIFQPHPRVFNVLHYADFDSPSLTTVDHLTKICKEAGPHLHGLQLDMIWPSYGLLSEFRSRFPGVELIVQISRIAIDMYKGDMKQIEKHVRKYRSLGVDYFLLDMSMGGGIPLDPVRTKSMIEDLVDITPLRSFVVAGGIGPETYFDLLRPILKWSNVISCDAQGKMRKSCLATDPIEMDRVCAYLRGASALV